MRTSIRETWERILTEELSEGSRTVKNQVGNDISAAERSELGPAGRALGIGHCSLICT